MKQIKLKSLEIRNFKGIKHFLFTPDGNNAEIGGENGTGKTTVFDAYLYLLFGKDSTGRKDFEIRPLDKQNKPIEGLVLSVDGVIEIDGVEHTFKKSQPEKVSKKGDKSYPTECWIDEVLKKVGEYQDYIKTIIDEDTFKMLADLHHFNAKLSWQDRRKVLLDIAGEIGTPDGFDELIASMKGRAVEDYRKVIVSQKKALVDKRDEITPRIDEIQRGLGTYTKCDDLQAKRKKVVTSIEKLDKDRTALVSDEQRRQRKLEKLNELKAEKSKRETEIKNDMSNVELLLVEQSEIRQELANREAEINKTTNRGDELNDGIKTQQIAMNRSMTELQNVRDKYTDLKAVDYLAEKCSACEQTLPKDRIKVLENTKHGRLTNLADSGKRKKNFIDKLKAEIVDKNKELHKILVEVKGLDAVFVSIQDAADKRLAEIKTSIENREHKPFDKDGAWVSITCAIADQEVLIGKSAETRLSIIDNTRSIKQGKLNKLNESLATADRMEKDTARIKELGEDEKKLSQQIADADKELDQIGKYKTKESNMISSAVNDKFKHTTFKLFKENLNGSVEDTCVSMLNGVPYTDLSTGQKIHVGIDIINTLSEHYGVSAPLFIDNAESMTMPINANGQVIKIKASKKKELTVII